MTICDKHINPCLRQESPSQSVSLVVKAPRCEPGIASLCWLCRGRHPVAPLRAALTSRMQNLPSANGISNSRRLPTVRVAVGCACLALSATATATYVKSGKQLHKIDLSRHKIPRPLIDAISGAVGEFGQILLLYPVETIKVRCQTEGISASAVLAVLVKQAAQPGGAGAVARQLYSGIGSSALFSMVVGAVHWLSFCTAKRAALEMLPDAPSIPPAPTSTSKASSAGSASSAKAKGASSPPNEAAPSTSSSGASGQHHHHIHISSLHHPHDEALDTDDAAAAAGSPPTAAASASPPPPVPSSTSRGQRQHGAAASGRKAAAAATSLAEVPATGAGGSDASGSAECSGCDASRHQLSKRMTANILAATFGALATALVESPVELFRHQAQAGLINGNLIREMGNSIRRDGPGALWYGFFPFLLEAFPYDVSELATYSQLRELHSEASRPSSRFNGLVSRMPTHAWDAAMGACAGVAAVMVSMPLDVVKTYVQTHAAGRLAISPAAQVALFFRTGRSMVQQRGMQALFVGMVPRLLQQVPSSTICWYSVEACQKALEPFAATSDSGASAGH